MPPPPRSQDGMMVGALLTLVGAAGLCLSSQLSVDEPRGLHVAPVNGGPGDVGGASQPGFSHHGGSTLLGIGALMVFILAWVLLSRPKKAWWLVVFSVAASGWLALLQLHSSFRTVYPVGPNGLPDRTAPIVFGLGTAGMVAAVGAGACLVGSLIMVRSAPE